MIKQTVLLGQLCLCYELTAMEGAETFPKEENTPHLMIKGSPSQCSWYLSKNRAGHTFQVLEKTCEEGESS